MALTRNADQRKLSTAAGVACDERPTRWVTWAGRRRAMRADYLPIIHANRGGQPIDCVSVLAGRVSAQG
jgi:hypothetical protein